ncbi:MAG: TIGR03067 domain-containing protein [Planctomycetes bacterium]|nr:TIGR03067 domain-containing protein [Planctomycetota bacterium]
MTYEPRAPKPWKRILKDGISPKSKYSLFKSKESIMKRYCTILFFVLLSFFVSSTAQAEVVTIEGTIKSIDKIGKKITIERKGKEKELDLSKDIDTSSLKIGQQIDLKFHLDLEIVVSIVDPMLAKLQGTWLCVASEEVGRVHSREIVKRQNRRMKIDGSKFSVERVSVNKLAKYSGTIKISDKNGFDFNGNGPGGNKDIEWVGIYELKGDILKLCFRYNRDGRAKRPTRFKTDSMKPNICVFYTFKKETEN